MSENNSKNDSSLMQSLKAAHSMKNAVKAGKVLAGAAKGAGIAGPYGAIACLAWEGKDAIIKAAPSIAVILMLPIILLTMLPSLIFGELDKDYDIPVMNNDSAIMQNIDEARGIILEVLSENQSEIITSLQGKINRLGEDEEGVIIPSSGIYNDVFLIISQYCAYKDDYKEIKMSDLRNTLKQAGNNLYTYSESISTKTVSKIRDEEEVQVTVTVYTYTISYVGDDYFAQNVFGLDEEKRMLSNEYAQNLMLLLYGTNLQGGGGGFAQVSDEVLALEPLIVHYATMYGIPEYVEVLKALMMTESGGRAVDAMQSSECAYNTLYPKRPNGITDTDYSIDCGVHYFADALRDAECSSPSDQLRLSLALQGYNYGLGYISWAKNKYGGYSESNAQEFSNKMKAQLGVKTYGNPLYVQHFMRYYIFGGSGGTEGYGSPFIGKDWTKAVTSEFGHRVDPITGKQGAYHDGLDMAYGKGTPINAIKGGTVIKAVTQTSGFGYHIVIDHGDGTTALYGHCSKLLVSTGQTVTKGQVIAEVGTTGRSTGNHLHLTIKLNGAQVNPRDYIKVE